MKDKNKGKTKSKGMSMLDIVIRDDNGQTIWRGSKEEYNKSYLE